ncbi:MAG: co-chaperone GroES [Candidatus Sumerlaeia bacterium]|nr:co-chaperone GroES [Candidatus Sumerlaeia bacterium]
MPIKPLGDRVLVQRLEEAEEKTAGGIIIPDTAKEKPQRGKVIAVGPGRMNEDGKLLPMNVKVGDEVLFGKYSGSDVKIDGVEYLIIKEDEIYGIIEGTCQKKK